ncbi:hypothetical protein GCM10017687_06730 [Streptomyces echinatus]
MGYFARCAPPPLGGRAPRRGDELCFYVFHPSRVARALPDAWAYARAGGRAGGPAGGDGRAAMTRLFGADTVWFRRASRSGPRDLAWEAAAARGQHTGRVLAAANQALERPDRPAARLWQGLTDPARAPGGLPCGGAGEPGARAGRGHGAQQAAAGESDGAFLRETRKWPEADWAAAEARLRADGRLAGGRIAHGRGGWARARGGRGADRRGGRGDRGRRWAASAASAWPPCWSRWPARWRRRSCCRLGESGRG